MVLPAMSAHNSLPAILATRAARQELQEPAALPKSMLGPIHVGCSSIDSCAEGLGLLLKVQAQHNVSLNYLDTHLSGAAHHWPTGAPRFFVAAAAEQLRLDMQLTHLQ